MRKCNCCGKYIPELSLFLWNSTLHNKNSSFHKKWVCEECYGLLEEFYCYLEGGRIKKGRRFTDTLACNGNLIMEDSPIT